MVWAIARVAGDVDRAAAEEVEDPHAALEPLAADPDEVGRWPLEPGRHHPPVVVPDGREALPIAGVAPDRPILDQLADQLTVIGQRCSSVGIRLVGGIGGPVAAPLTSGVP